MPLVLCKLIVKQPNEKVVSGCG